MQLSPSSVLVTVLVTSVANGQSYNRDSMASLHNQHSHHRQLEADLNQRVSGSLPTNPGIGILGQALFGINQPLAPSEPHQSQGQYDPNKARGNVALNQASTHLGSHELPRGLANGQAHIDLGSSHSHVQSLSNQHLVDFETVNHPRGDSASKQIHIHLGTNQAQIHLGTDQVHSDSASNQPQQNLPTNQVHINLAPNNPNTELGSTNQAHGQLPSNQAVIIVGSNQAQINSESGQANPAPFPDNSNQMLTQDRTNPATSQGRTQPSPQLPAIVVHVGPVRTPAVSTLVPISSVLKDVYDKSRPEHGDLFTTRTPDMSIEEMEVTLRRIEHLLGPKDGNNTGDYTGARLTLHMLAEQCLRLVHTRSPRSRTFCMQMNSRFPS